MPNVAKFAQALFALDQIGALKDEACKEPVTLFIRKATEDRHWHVSAQFRSRAAAAMIAGQPIRTVAQYQRFCVGHLRHEHMVPNAVIYRLIRDTPVISVEFLEATLRRFGQRATISREEDAQLTRDRMPEGFYIPGHELHMNPFARYIAAGLHRELEQRPGSAWF